MLPRIAGPLEGPNQLAGYFDVAIPVLLALTLARGSRNRLLPAALTIAACADLLTFSRAGLAAQLAAMLIVIAIARPRWGALRVVAAVAAAGLRRLGVFGATGTLSRLTSFDDADRPTGLGTRSELWHAAIMLWRSHPWLGVGGGNYELELPRAGVTDAQTHANSLYLQSLAEGGVVLFLATIGTIAAALLTMWKEARNSPFALGPWARRSRSPYTKCSTSCSTSRRSAGSGGSSSESERARSLEHHFRCAARDTAQ